MSEHQIVFAHKQTAENGLQRFSAQSVGFCGLDMTIVDGLRDNMEKSGWGFMPLKDNCVGFSLNSKDSEQTTCHIIVSDDAKGYPLEYYGSKSFKDDFEFTEYSTDHLPEVAFEKGEVVTFDKVGKFLTEGDRWDSFVKMLSAFWENSQIEISDKDEKSLLWAGGICYAYPEKISKSVSIFCPEENAPCEDFRINCLTAEELSFIGQDSETVIQSGFFDMLKSAFSGDRGELDSFHKFLENGYSYSKADGEILSAFDLYLVLSALSEGVEKISDTQLFSALDFAEKFADKSEKDKICELILTDNSEIYACSGKTFAKAVELIYSCELDQPQKKVADKLVTAKIIDSTADAEISDEELVMLFNGVEKALCTKGEGVSSLVLSKENFADFRSAVLGLKDAKFVARLKFIVDVLFKFAFSEGMEINEYFPDTNVGRLVYDILQNAYTNGSEESFGVVSEILDNSSADCQSLLNTVIFLDGVMSDEPCVRHREKLWECANSMIFGTQLENLTKAFGLLLGAGLEERVFALYAYAMERTANIRQSENLFKEHTSCVADSADDYSQRYRSDIFREYYLQIRSAEDGGELRTKLLIKAFAENIRGDFLDDLILEVVKKLRLKAQTEENSRLIQNIFMYQRIECGKSVHPRILLLMSGMYIQNAVEKSVAPQEIIEGLERITDGKKLVLTKLPEKAEQTLSEWLVPIIAEKFISRQQLNQLMEFFEMSESLADIWSSALVSEAVRKFRSGDTSLDELYEVTVFSLCQTDSEGREEMGKNLCRLGKSVLSQLDELVNSRCEDEGQLISLWSEVYESAVSTNPILNEISNLFKRLKK